MPSRRTLAARSCWPCCPASGSGAGDRAEQREMGDLVRVLRGQGADGDGAHRVPHHPHRDRSRGRRRERPGPRRSPRSRGGAGDRGATGALQVGPDHLEPLGESGDLRLVEGRGPTQPVHQEDRGALAGDLDGQFLTVDVHCRTTSSSHRIGRIGRSLRPAHAMGLRIAPRPEMAHSTTSPVCRNLGGVEPDTDPGRRAGGR